ncbi:Alcohol dehydrogenase GroES domain protein (plasmid) [Gemmatirosa kalamazoonensis]|uniref:Alcohol dehydrogenase GroES domain protein n=1 Tax=Gemmatirosa kalamazoonensis TaxID=861299 RepID=W0RTG9_9BACT|nr:zinc-binding dehydrogenase [Gemmatirosa kalamazoonensis]AHG93737.1 Alcohol dehydrogenase GroES domain protein [Gemmatirosa kalamazoonensis]
MRALRLTAPGHPVELHDVPVPALGPRDVLVRVRAAGICHSDAHYRAGRSPARPLPLVLGHEVAGVVERVGEMVTLVRPGDRVCLHYLIACADCWHCSRGSEQFCRTGSMIGHFRDGGWAEYIAVPERNAVRLPDEIPLEHGAVLMCSSATSLHALRKGRIVGGDRVAVFGVGGLGMSAVQLARALGALDVFAVDLDDAKLAMAESFGAIPISARGADPVATILERTGGAGVDVALELIGLPLTMRQAVQALGVQGRAVVAGLADRPLELDTYRDLLGKEAELIGANDHLLQELPLLLELARRRALDLARVVARTVPLDADAVNAVLDELDRFGAPVRTVIVPDPA